MHSLESDISRLAAQSTLARSDVGGAIAKGLAEAEITSLTLSDMDAALDRVEDSVLPTMAKVESMMASGDLSSLVLDGVSLDRLLENDAEDYVILTRGLRLLSHSMSAEAIEYWTLARQSLDASQAKLNLVLTLFLALAYHWSGDINNASRCLQDAKQCHLWHAIKNG